jgi:hypothetical protein
MVYGHEGEHGSFGGDGATIAFLSIISL